jgi:hypothetical protein
MVDQLTLACVVEISLSLYKLTPFSLNNLPVERPILKISSSPCKYGVINRFEFQQMTAKLTGIDSNLNFWPMCGPVVHFNIKDIDATYVNVED